MSAAETYGDLSREQLFALIDEQGAQIEQLQALVAQLRSQMEELKRAGKRQATPFATGKHKKKRKKPGRKKGAGEFANRAAPKEEDYSAPATDVPVEDEWCECGAELVGIETETVTTTELPESAKPVIKAYHIHKKRCVRCGRVVRGEHPEVAPDQQGATAHRLGPRAYAVGHSLHYEIGVPMRGVPEILKMLGGIEVTQSALTQEALKQSRGYVGSEYEKLRGHVKDAPVVFTDDTGWKVEGQAAFLMAFDTDEETIYQIRKHHRNEEVREVIPGDYPGVMTTDRGTSYDAKEFGDVEQQKCLAHAQRNLSEVRDNKQRKARWFSVERKRLLKAGNDLWGSYHRGEMSLEQYLDQGEQIDKAVTEHLRNRNLTDVDNQRLLDGFGKQHDRGHLLRFLKDPRLEPTNNRAERAVRGAVIARKVSQCSKNWDGARATSAYKSVLKTLQKRGRDVVDGLVDIFLGKGLPDPDPG